MDKSMLLEMQPFSYFASKGELRQSINERVRKLRNKLTPSTLCVLDVLRLRSMKVLGVAYLKIETIMALTKVSRASVERAIRKLEQEGIIKRISTSRKTGLQGANIYYFLPLNDGVELTGLDKPETPEKSKVEATKQEANTGVFNTPKRPKETKKNNVNGTHLAKDNSVVPSYIPRDFAKLIQQGFSCGRVIKQFWSKVVMFKNVTGWTRNENVLPIAADAWEYTKNEYKRDKREWELDRFLKCFYGTMKRIEEKRVEEYAAIWT
ncbi:helix-turn-helix domain-containing protein [Brevibacillus sp. MER 51]|uniref:helix-turn-helix domain-containing protein n=1 Tax=Brevibacillus sp. MER 51 TaxID=2939560 RepID=UPI00203E8336|nr:helix-turn-helix domain-containing protein [Brevibacillus sp. MER 51]MCM3141338.1 helix-turn-helix domain-containing protein [Brevibacillus sp. MER 51]